MSTTRLALVHQDGTTNVRPVNFYLCTLTTDIAAIATQAKGDLAYDGQALILYSYNGAAWDVVNVNILTGGKVPLSKGGTAADLSATGGTSQYVKQVGVGAAFTVGLPSLADIDSNWTINGQHILNSSTQFRCSVYNSAVQSVAGDSVDHLLTFDTEDFDVGGMHSTSVNTSRITIPTGGAGLYYVRGRTIARIGATFIISSIAKNGTVISRDDWVATSATAFTTAKSESLLVLADADYVEFLVAQDAGVNKNFGAASRDIASDFFAVKLW